MELTGTEERLVTETLRLRRLRTQTLRLRGGLVPSLEAEETSNPDLEAEEGSYPDPEAHTNTKQQKLNMTVLTSKPRGVSVVPSAGAERAESL